MEESSMGKNQNVVPHNGQWAIRGVGNSRVTKVCSTQREAQEIARGIARNQHSEVVIHRLLLKVADLFHISNY